MNEKAQLRFLKADPVPYALKPKVEKERLQGVGTVEPVRFSEWAAPIVPVPKSDQTVCICGAYTVTVNQASRLDQYPKTENLLATLGRGESSRS